MPKKKTTKNNDIKKSRGKSNNKAKKKEKEIPIEPEKIIEVPKRPKIIRIKTELVHDNPSQANETIVKSIVDKIITLSVRNSYLNTIDNSLEDYYFDYLKNQVNTLFATNNLFYYDEPENEQLNKKELFWNKKYEKGNTWIEISEPNTSKCDRYENAFMSYINYNYNSSSLLPSVSGPIINRANTVKEIGNSPKPKDELAEIKDKKLFKKFSVNIRGIKNKGMNQKVLDTLEERSSLSSLDEENKDIKNTNNKKTKNNVNIQNKSTHKISPPKDNNKSLFSNITNNNANNANNANKKQKKEPVLEMKNKEIPGIEKEYNYEKYDPPDIKLLRKEKQEEITRKEIEERKNARNRKIMNISKKENTDNFIDTHTKIKMFDSNKFSFDSNGKIINFKPIKIDSLIKDFVSLKNGIKSIDNNIKIKKLKKIKKNNDNSPRKYNKSNSYIKEKIIKNPEDDPNGINKHNYVKINTDKNEQIIPSGSNFSIMLPNIGVILKEDEQIKEGAKEFGKYFKKYSLNDYDKILREYVPLQNKTMLKNKMNQSMNNINLNRTTNKRLSKKLATNTSNSFKMNSNTNFNNSIGNNLLLSSQTQNYTQINNIYNNSDASNPLINEVDTIQENENNTFNINNEYNANNLNSINNSSLFKTFKSNKNQSSLLNSTPFSLMKNGSYDNLLGVIKLNKNTSSLKNELDSLKDLDDKDNLNFYPTKDKIDQYSRNIFANNYKDLFKEKKKQTSTINNLNEFNKKIISTKGWGNKTISKNMSTGNLLFSKHLTKYQALRELGSNLLNGIKVKLPRDRKVDIKI